VNARALLKPLAAGELRSLLGTPELEDVPWDRWDAVALAVTVATTAWLFAVKLGELRGGAYALDLFNFTQNSTSWFDGRGLLFDTRGGNMLRVHTFFVLIALGPLTKALGPQGLLLALALSTGLVIPVASRLLRALGVAGWASVAFATLVALSPLRTFVALDPLYGFHPENLIGPLVLALLHAVLARRVVRALFLALVVLSVKEEMPLIVGAVAALALAERALGSGRMAARGTYRAAVAVLGLAVVALPILLAIIEHNADPPGSGFWRISMHNPDAARGTSSLARWAIETSPRWIASFVAHEWLRILVCSAFGLLVLRPHAVVLGFPLSGVSWVTNDPNILVAPGRAATTLAFGACVSVLAFASVWRVLASRWTKTRSRPLGVARCALAALTVPPCLAVSALPLMLTLPPLGGDALGRVLHAYRLEPSVFYSPAEVRLAKEAFAPYLAAARPSEPVVAAPSLEFLAHHETLLFEDAQPSFPQPKWILWDVYWKDFTQYGLSHADYELASARGRFALFRRKSGAPPDARYPVPKHR
jgi:hypothetical protein